MMERTFDVKYKLLLLGESTVGKSSILLKFANDSFSSTFITTIGENRTKRLRVFCSV